MRTVPARFSIMIRLSVNGGRWTVPFILMAHLMLSTDYIGSTQDRRSPAPETLLKERTYHTRTTHTHDAVAVNY